MSGLDVTRLLEPISPESPCGDDMEYDPSFGEFERAATEKPEQQYGDTIIPARPPEWREVKRIGLDLLEKTKDLRILIVVSRALLQTDGWKAFANSVELLNGYIDQYWDTVHPQLDPGDDNDPTERLNIISSLNDRATTLRLIEETPLVTARGFGSFSWRDILAARGESGDHKNAPEMSAVEAAFANCELDQLRDDVDSVQQAIDLSKATESKILDKLGSAYAINLEDLQTEMRQIHGYLAGQLAQRQPAEPAAETESIDSDLASLLDEDVTPQAVGDRPPLVRSQEISSISSRQDVIRALEKICEYYENHEPSSPVPLLLKRAKRLAVKSFLEIIEDLTPEGLTQARSIGGVDSDGETN